MHRVVLTAQVENAVEWEKGFRTHGDLFRGQTITAMHFTVTNENEVAIYNEVDDLDKWRQILESPATAEAMKYDGVKRETVKFYVLDKKFDL